MEPVFYFARDFFSFLQKNRKDEDFGVESFHIYHYCLRTTPYTFR